MNKEFPKKMNTMFIPIVLPRFCFSFSHILPLVHPLVPNKLFQLFFRLMHIPNGKAYSLFKKYTNIYYIIKAPLIKGMLIPTTTIPLFIFPYE